MGPDVNVKRERDHCIYLIIFTILWRQSSGWLIMTAMSLPKPTKDRLTYFVFVHEWRWSRDCQIIAWEWSWCQCQSLLWADTVVYWTSFWYGTGRSKKKKNAGADINIKKIFGVEMQLHRSCGTGHSSLELAKWWLRRVQKTRAQERHCIWHVRKDN